jgi:hypothetical protein
LHDRLSSSASRCRLEQRQPNIVVLLEDDARRHVPQEHILRLNHVIVHADENQIPQLHRYPLAAGNGRPARESLSKN